MEAKYWSRDQVTFVEDRLEKVLSNMTCLNRPYHLKFFKGCLPQMLLGPLLNIFSQLNPYEKYNVTFTHSHLSFKTNSNLLKIEVLKIEFDFFEGVVKPGAQFKSTL